jgi:3-phenylpropionate/trans-cinnamate dioxygenase ferredoxin reductase subunit
VLQDKRVVVLGAGQAGGSFAGLLRQGGFTGEITVIGDEPLAPYQRPPLSKAFLKNEVDAGGLRLRPDSYYGEKGITLRLGAAATAIDPAARRVTLSEGSSFDYDILVIATGSRPRRLPFEGSDLNGIYELRTVADAERIKRNIIPGMTFAMIGGGYIGLEVAASVKALGGEAIVIEREPRILARVASEPLSSFFTRYHRSLGVRILTAMEVAGFAGDAEGAVNGVMLKDGNLIPVDAALLCVGGVANDEIARAAGIDCDGGIVVDLSARTSDPAVFAIGDVTKRPVPYCGHRMLRLESVPNALEQAKQAVAAILDKPRPADEVPWFWSDQFAAKLQIAGLSFDPDEIIVRGEPSVPGFSILHMKGDQLICVEAISAPADFMSGKTLIQQRKRLDLTRLADKSVPLKSLAVE